jgi:radical SAM protein with 4Fe4S-binding SPASM domain
MDINLRDIIPVDYLPYRVDRPMATSTVCLIVTNRCNIWCDYCFNYIRDSKHHEDMSPETAVGVIDQLRYYHSQSTNKPFIPHIIFFGGEPTLNMKVIDNVMEYIDAHHIDCIPRLVTNGIMSDSLLDKLIDEMFYFQISYDGEEANLRRYKNDISSPSARVIQTLHRVARANLPIFIRATVHAGNVHRMKDVVTFAAEHGATAVAFAPLALMGNALHTATLRPGIADYVENYFAALELALSLGIHFYSCEMDEFVRGGRPYAPPLVILPDGQIAFSIKFASSKVDRAPAFMVGHYQRRSEQHMIEFFDQKIRHLIQNFAVNQEKFCLNCSAFNYCRGRRMYDLFSANPAQDDYDSYYCTISRHILERLPEYKERLAACNVEGCRTI